MASTGAATMIVSIPAIHPKTGKPVNFNKDYYMNTHVPSVAKVWENHGFLGCNFHEFANPNPVTGQPPEFIFQTVGYFETAEGMFQAAGATRESSMAELPNFLDADVEPVIAIATKVGEHSVKK